MADAGTDSADNEEAEAFFPANSVELAELQKEVTVGDTEDSTTTHNTSAATESPTSIWPRMRDGFKLDLTEDNRRIAVELEWYARNQSYLNRTFLRAERYLHHIVEEVEKRNIPMEMALLPVVESAFDPFAYSHGRASGIWQFIPGTGKMYGLKQDWWYDGRRDVVASTDAALNYLDHLAGRFDGDWQHALASYNSGGGTVSKAIRLNTSKGKPTDFWSLKLPRETRAYVPKLIAIAKIVADPEKYGVTLPHIDNKPQFEVINAESQIDLAQAAKLAEIDLNDLYLLNPGFNRWATPPLGPHKLAIPIAQADIFRQNLSALPKDQRVNWQRYKVKSGDSLISISKKHHTTPQVIKDVNKLRSSFIRIGDTLLIPVATKSLDQYALSAGSRLETTQSKYTGTPGLAKIDYEVRSGDTLWDLSRKYSVGVRSLAKWNGIAPTDPLKPKQKLVIWSKAGPQKASTQNINVASNQIPSSRTMIRKINYRVRSGDSLARIADKFNVRVSDIVGWNKINPKTYLQPGQRLTLHVDIASGY
ncbi:MAG: LysM peptidoglycan-binding domain-containing protein [Hahellaceae bacterium]|nr:LysM peptidoglycan-binding domain-containing protein [Hahellaceae bacterium]MCP5212877.1 LysM peptidoglycan-binding domain-containing protein [Hahellaceae bacterium]